MASFVKSTPSDRKLMGEEETLKFTDSSFRDFAFHSHQFDLKC